MRATRKRVLPDNFVRDFNAARLAGSQATVAYDGVEVNTTGGAELRAGDAVAPVSFPC